MTKSPLRTLWAAGLLGLALLCLAAAALAADYGDPDYLAAVADARVALPSEISRQLSPIVAHNKNLIWEGQPGESRVLVVTWTGGYYDAAVGEDYLLSFGQVWVTLAPQMQDFFRRRPAQRGDLRAEQLLGLPPGQGYFRFVEMWVNPADLFRPSPDPEITDQEAQLDFPDGVWTTTNPQYREWFNQRRQTSYQGDQPYPWTRLGYTYDWGSSDHQGLSEFVVRQNAVVGVKSAQDNQSYLGE